MVHVKSDSNLSGAVGPSYEYWKLASIYGLTAKQLKGALAQSNFYSRSGENKQRLRQLFHRMKRGLISYEKYTLKNLREFAHDRKVESITHQDKSKAAIVQKLEKEDDKATFTKFMDLPPELRTRIYEMSLEHFELPYHPQQPPLCRVSRQIRHEALPVFYSKCTFEVPIQWYKDSSLYQPGRWLKEKEPSCMNASFFKNSTKEHVSWIKKMHVELLGWGPAEVRLRVGWALDLNASPGADTAVVHDTFTEKQFRDNVYFQNEDTGSRIQDMTDRLRLLVNHIIARPETHKLRKRDITFTKNVFSH